MSTETRNTDAYCFGNPDMVRKPRVSDWTQADEDRLCGLASEGYTIEQIADELGRSALKEIAADIGMHFSYVSDILNYESRYRESIALIERAMEGK